jgi:RNase P/RNase MRP subunit POP5
MVVLDRDRYVVFQILPENKGIQIAELKRNIWSMYQKLYGLNGTTEAGLYFEEFDETNGMGLVRCNSKSLSNFMTSIAMITTIDKNEVLIMPLYITGLINKAKKYILESTSLNHND